MSKSYKKRKASLLSIIAGLEDGDLIDNDVLEVDEINESLPGLDADYIDDYDEECCDDYDEECCDDDDLDAFDDDLDIFDDLDQHIEADSKSVLDDDEKMEEYFNAFGEDFLEATDDGAEEFDEFLKGEDEKALTSSDKIENDPFIYADDDGGFDENDQPGLEEEGSSEILARQVQDGIKRLESRIASREETIKKRLIAKKKAEIEDKKRKSDKSCTAYDISNTGAGGVPSTSKLVDNKVKSTSMSRLRGLKEKTKVANVVSQLDRIASELETSGYYGHALKLDQISDKLENNL